MTHRIESIASANGQNFNAYVSEPTAPNGHAVIVLQEIFGVTKHIRRIADRFAQDGYVAYAPDLFWRTEPGLELSHSKEDIERALAIMGRYRDEDGLADIASVVAHMRTQHGFQGRVAVAGLCMGGKLAYLAATRKEIDAAVAFYGVGIEKCLGHAADLCRPLMMHFGDRDGYVPEAARAQIAKAVAGRNVEMFIYPGADHGFYTRGSEQDVVLARERTNAFLQTALQR